MQELEGDSEEVRGLGGASPEAGVGMCGLERPGRTGRCSWNETGRGLGGGTGFWLDQRGARPGDGPTTALL